MSAPMLVGSQLLPTPVVLRGTATIAAAGGITSPAPFDTTRMQNTLRVPIEITEILVTTKSYVTIDGVLTNPAIGGASVELDLRVGGKHLTNGFVPFQTLAPWDGNEDNAWAAAKFNPGGGGVVVSFNQRRVVLPEPLRLRPNVGFSGSARRSLPASVTTVPTVVETVSLAFIGRAVPGGITQPTAQAIPLWTSAVLYGSTTDLVKRTSERDLFNPLTVPLDVARIIVSASTHSVNMVAVPGTKNFYTDFDPRLTLRWPNGDLIGMDPIYLQSAFIREHTITDRFQLPPGSRVDATFAFVDATANPYAMISIFGTRKEVL